MNLEKLSLLVAALCSTVAAAAPPPRPAEVLRAMDQRAAATAGYASFGYGGTPLPEGSDQTLAPYFHVPGGSEGETLPLKETSAKVQIAGVIARVKIRQVFENGGNKPIEAVYVFPGSTRAAVHAMRMKIGERTLEAKIDKRDAARRTYEAARQQGQRASLLEQQRPNVFTMNVANLMPKDRIEVELEYSELIVPEDATYEFVYPTVVGPRYGGGADPVKDGWISNPYLTEGTAEPYKFDIQVHLETGIALKELASPSHKVAVKYASSSSVDVALDQAGGGNKDFVLRYRLAGDRIETGLLLFPGEKENFFALMMEPPRRPAQAEIPPREYVFVLDISGSMHGFPLETAKALMKNLLAQLRPTDTFNVVLFAGSASVLSPAGSLPASASNLQQAEALIQSQRGGGSTELLGALQTAYRLPKKERGVSRSVVVVTDGYVGVERQTFKFIREHLNEANVFAFGIGSSVNRALIEGMARAGLGEPFVVLKPDLAREEAQKLQKYISQPVLSGIDLKFEGFDAYEIAPSKLPDLMAQRPVLVFGKYRGTPSGRVTLTGHTGHGRHTQTISVNGSSAKTENAPLRWLWARKWVEILEDEHHLMPAQEIVDAIVDLGLTYTLLTPFTSFVAVDSQVVNAGGTQDTVKQPLPLPEGVSNYAVGNGSAPAKGVAPLGMKKEAAKDDVASLSFGNRALRRPMSSVAAEAEPPPAPESKAMLDVARVGGVSKESKIQIHVDVLTNPGNVAAAPAIAELERWIRRGCLQSGTAEVELTLDTTGKVTRIDARSSSHAAMARCLQKLLKDAVGKSWAQSGGVLKLRVKVGTGS
jgi:Ca-activated chloride channel homolog